MHYLTATLLQVLKKCISNKVRYFIRSNYVRNLRYNYVTFWFVNLVYLFLRQNYVVNALATMTYFHDVRVTFPVVRFHYVWKKCYNYFSLFFAIVMYFLLHHNYVIYLFDVVTFFDDIKITLYFGRFKLHTEITLQNGNFNVMFVSNHKNDKKNT